MLYEFVGKFGCYYKLNANCKDSEKSGTGPGSCGGNKNNPIDSMKPGEIWNAGKVGNIKIEKISGDEITVTANNLTETMKKSDLKKALKEYNVIIVPSDKNTNNIKITDKNNEVNNPVKYTKKYKNFSKINESKDSFMKYINQNAKKNFSNPKIQNAISNTNDAKLTNNGLELTVVRYQETSQSGSNALRGGVFYLPEKGGTGDKIYTKQSNEYGGSERFEGNTIYRNPIFVDGNTGGSVPMKVYKSIVGQEQYVKLLYSLDNVRKLYQTNFNNKKIFVQELENVLKLHGGDPKYASEIYDMSTKEKDPLGIINITIRENIFGNVAKMAGYDSIIGIKKSGSGYRLSEVFDLRENKNPSIDNWNNQYSDYYDKFYKSHS